MLNSLIPPKLCKGTRLQVKALHINAIVATIFTGCGAEYRFLEQIIPLIPTDFHFQFKRLQFPVKVYFAITVSKTQEQSLKVARVDLMYSNTVVSPIADCTPPVHGYVLLTGEGGCYL